MKALYAGTFDPPTLGHIDLIHRGSELFDHLIVGIGVNSMKNEPILSVQQRTEGLKEELAHLHNVEVAVFSGLATQFAKDQDIQVLLRGIRSESDVEYEMQMARANRRVGKLETLFLFSDEYSGISSSLIRELAAEGAPLEQFIPKRFEEMIHPSK